MDLEIPEFPESKDSENDGHSGGISKISTQKELWLKNEEQVELRAIHNSHRWQVKKFPELEAK